MIFRTFSYRRADIRGRRAVGDKRRSAWPEIFTCFIPFFWCLNLLNNSLAILKMIEVNGSYVALTLQIIGFQWGWRYNYGEANYFSLLIAPIKVGYNSLIRPGFGKDIEGTKPQLLKEVHFCRSWLRRSGSNPHYRANLISVPTYRQILGVVAQGSPANETGIKTYVDHTTEFTIDPLRLLRATNALVVPTRHVIRLLATSEDITHSWAVPGLGLKLDCVPGRLFVSFININREGVYYGQCSELCGWNHYNMPIIVYAIPIEHFIAWWELELHGLFNKSVSKWATHYSIFNFKFK